MKFAITAAPFKRALKAKAELEDLYGNMDPADAEIIVAVGGDGFMLESLHETLGTKVHVYGMNRGSVGFLMNSYARDDLIERLKEAQPTVLKPLIMHARDTNGVQHTARAINEVALFRETGQTAKIRISVDGTVRMEELICDGVLISTAAGSTAYNLSAHGPILPIGSRTLALTPISAFRPRRWRGAILSESTHVMFEVLDDKKRPVSAAADSTEIRNVRHVGISTDQHMVAHLLFDKDRNLEERVLVEQFES